MLGSDYCFDMGLNDPVGDLERLRDLKQPQRELILAKTAAHLLHI